VLFKLTPITKSGGGVMYISKSILSRSLVITVALAFAAGSMIAQDAAKVAAKNVKVLLDNEKVLVLDFNLKAGDKIPMDSHPDQVLYAITSAKVKTSFPDGKTQETEFKAGEARWSDPVTHSNEALTDGHVIVIELKPAKAMEKKMERK